MTDEDKLEFSDKMFRELLEHLGIKMKEKDLIGAEYFSVILNILKLFVGNVVLNAARDTDTRQRLLLEFITQITLFIVRHDHTENCTDCENKELH